MNVAYYYGGLFHQDWNILVVSNDVDHDVNSNDVDYLNDWNDVNE